MELIVDTSALLAIVFAEPEGERCAEALSQADRRAISSVTLTEVLVVAARRGVAEELDALLARSWLEVVAVDRGVAHKAARAYSRWGKGVHPAHLNLADCFAYALAEERGAPLLYVGRDFAQTDLASAIPRADL